MVFVDNRWFSVRITTHLSGSKYVTFRVPGVIAAWMNFPAPDGELALVRQVRQAGLEQLPLDAAFENI